MSRQRFRRRRGFVGATILIASLLGCARAPREAEVAGSAPRPRSVDPPAVEGSLAPNLTTAGSDVAASWLEPVDLGGVAGHRLRFARYRDGRWSRPVTITEGTDFFANWADIPAVVETGSGALLAHWLAKTAADTYAYSIFLARSEDGGEGWTPLGKLNADATDTEHGFVSWVPEEDGARAFWLDGREMAAGGSMTVRTARVGEAIGPEEHLDGRTCECCSTDAALGADGAILVYRDRSGDETRDVAVVRREAEGWSAPAPVAADGWRIEGCPVNGPAVAADRDRVVASWYTAAGEGPRVQVAFSGDGGRAFDAPVVLDSETPLGRVDLVLDQEGFAWVSWLGAREGEAEVMLRRVGPDGPDGEPVRIATTSVSRASGFPRLVRAERTLYLAWVDVAADEPQRIRMQELPLASLD